tara:strand:+ start:1171 stop:2004 length:834 start_codon:yes stop_codon:yes gene_type:complete
MNKERSPECRLCGSPTSDIFQLTVLSEHEVHYYECLGCGSLQTEAPYWLDTAYNSTNLSREDTGAAQRSIQNSAAVFAISRLLNLKNVFDFGGGDGLLCRLLRDTGINCFLGDKYATPTYAQGFTEPDFEVPDLVVAFEVIEHFENPRSDFHQLFRKRPKAILLSTCIYKKQKEDWWYLSPSSGQHIFFYSQRALEDIGKAHGYRLVVKGDYILYVPQNQAVRGCVAGTLLSLLAIRITRLVLVFLPSPGVQRDHQFQVAKSKREANQKPAKTLEAQ